MTCATCGSGTLLKAGLGIKVSGSGSPTNPYIVDSELAEVAVLEVRDTDTVNLSLAGAGTLSDPYVLRADTGSAGRLTQLADINSAPPIAGQVPVWVGSSVSGNFVFKPNGVLYCTSTTRPASADRYSGLQIKETDTGKRYEWNGGAWDDITPSLSGSVAAGSLTGTLNDSTLPARLQSTAQLLTSENLNTVLNSGWYRGSAITNAPSTGWWYYQVIRHTSAYAVQVAHSLTSTDTFKRVLNNGAWSSWDRMKTDQTVLREAAGAVTVTNMQPDSSTSRGGYSQTIHVTLPSTRFTSTPSVVAQEHATTSTEQRVGVANVGPTGFDIYYWRANVNNNVRISWMAKEIG